MKSTIEFLKFRYIAYAVSAGLFIAFTTFTVMQGGINFGIDFVGGVKIIAKFEKHVSETDLRKSLSGMNPLIQQIGEKDLNEFIISTKLAGDSTDDSKKSLEQIKTELNKNFKNIEFLSEETVGPAIGNILKRSAIKLFIISIILMTVYLAFRFEFKYSVGAMAALLHDIAISVAFIGFARVELNIPVVAALLTIFGYSVNDTIVIFDRIRENVQVKSKQTFTEVIDKSVNQSMSRTLLTSLTTLFSVAALYFLGGEVLNDFAKVLLFGIAVGTYSSIYIASPILVAWEKLLIKK
ncbi:MAG: protein translocase subunit SecF [Spirochaetae bacterium HGW-Spirochaetae-1]|nr:MAG: protein translocase subunit SecF [Spirochaetae bacterium HGW-Spirochaetae-1]